MERPLIQRGVVDPFSEEALIVEKKTRRRGNKIEVDGIIREVLELSKEETAAWFSARMPVYYDIIHELVTSKDTPKAVKVKVLELITKITGQVVEKHEIKVINPEDITRRGIEAVKEIEGFKVKLLEQGADGS